MFLQSDKQTQRERLEALEKERVELAERRKLENEQVREWMKLSQLDGSDDEKETRKTKKASRPRVKTEPDSADERESKKRRRGKLKRSANASEDDNALFSENEETETKPAAKKVR